MLFEIINPHDPYTMEAPDLEIAAVAIAILGGGQYGLKELSGDKSGEVPVFLIGGHDEWFVKQFGRDFAATLDIVATNRRDALVKSLASVWIGDAASRRHYNENTVGLSEEEFDIFIAQHHDIKRTSTFDIGHYAWSCADAIATSADITGQLQ